MILREIKLFYIIIIIIIFIIDYYIYNQEWFVRYLYMF